MAGNTDAIADNPGLFAVRKGEVALTRRPLPALAAGQVRVQVAVSMISPGTEMHFILDNHTHRAQYPVEIGYISAGTIVGVGSGVAPDRIGERVLSVAGHSAMHNLDPSLVHVLPDGMAFADACPSVLLGVSVRAIRASELRFGDSVAVVGLGLVGLYALHLAKLAGAFPVIGIDPVASRREVALALGADSVIDPATADVRQLVRARTANEGAAVTIDATGSPNVISSLPMMTAQYGRIAILGGVHAAVPMDLYHVMKADQRIVGCGKAMPRDFPHDERRNVATLIAMIHAGMIKPRPTLTHQAPVAQATEMYQRLLREKDMLGVVFDWN